MRDSDVSRTANRSNRRLIFGLDAICVDCKALIDRKINEIRSAIRFQKVRHTTTFFDGVLPQIFYQPIKRKRAFGLVEKLRGAKNREISQICLQIRKVWRVGRFVYVICAVGNLCHAVPRQASFEVQTKRPVEQVERASALVHKISTA